MSDQPLTNSEQSTNQPRTSMGMNMDGSAWVRHGDTTYRVHQRSPGFPARDYRVECEAGPDVLDHDYVRSCANDAFIDAFGAV